MPRDAYTYLEYRFKNDEGKSIKFWIKNPTLFVGFFISQNLTEVIISN